MLSGRAPHSPAPLPPVARLVATWPLQSSAALSQGDGVTGRRRHGLFDPTATGANAMATSQPGGTTEAGAAPHTSHTVPRVHDGIHTSAPHVRVCVCAGAPARHAHTHATAEPDAAVCPLFFLGPPLTSHVPRTPCLSVRGRRRQSSARATGPPPQFPKPRAPGKMAAAWGSMPAYLMPLVGLAEQLRAVSGGAKCPGAPWLVAWRTDGTAPQPMRMRVFDGPEDRAPAWSSHNPALQARVSSCGGRRRRLPVVDGQPGEGAGGAGGGARAVLQMCEDACRRACAPQLPSPWLVRHAMAIMLLL